MVVSLYKRWYVLKNIIIKLVRKKNVNFVRLIVENVKMVKPVKHVLIIMS